MSASDWAIYGVCPCGFKREAPFGDLFHIHLEVCPDCATSKRRWELVTMRWVATGQLFKPSTWGTGHWETPEMRDAPTLPLRNPSNTGSSS